MNRSRGRRRGAWIVFSFKWPADAAEGLDDYKRCLRRHGTSLGEVIRLMLAFHLVVDPSTAGVYRVDQVLEAVKRCGVVRVAVEEGVQDAAREDEEVHA